MRYGLPAVCAAVIYQSETAVRDSQFEYQTVGDSMDVADDVISRRNRQNGFVVFLWTDDHMHWRLWVDVVKGKDMIIFIHNRRWDFAVYDFTKDTIFRHNLSPF